jgi:VanZ family protein
LRFSGHGSAASAGAFRSRRPPNDTGCSLEILLKPARTAASGSILAFDSSTDPRVPFLLRQYGTSVAVLRYVVDEHGQVTRPWYKVDQVLEAGKQVLVTVTSGKDNVALYVNGVMARRFSDSGIASGELTGQLVLANSTVDDSWRGEIMGLAIYSRELTPGQVREHSQSWTPEQEPLSAGEQALTARYLFNERDGNIVHNQVDPATNLIVPAKYFVLHPAFLRPTWAEYSHAGSFWEDLGVNVCGFVPVGFVFFAYFSAVRHLRHPALMAVLMGLFLSCSVEVLQRLLPNRDSGMTDLLTNTTGTALGVLLYRSSYVQDLWMKALEFVARILQCGVTKRGRQHSACLGRASKVIVAGHSVDTQT